VRRVSGVIVANRNARFGTGSLNDGRIPNFRGVRVHVSTGYNRAEGNRRALRNGRVSDLHPKSLRFAFCTAVRRATLHRQGSVALMERSAIEAPVWLGRVGTNSRSVKNAVHSVLPRPLTHHLDLAGSSNSACCNLRGS
jgi:hypothetical protein